MEKKLIEQIEKCYEICDYIEENMKGITAPKPSVRENLKQEFLNFALYISFANAKYSDFEQTFIKEHLGIKVTEDDAYNLKVTRVLYENNYGRTVPFILKYMVVADAGRKIKGDKYLNKKAKTLVETYRNLGQTYIATNPAAGEPEVRVMTGYISMLDNFLKTYGLLNIDHKTRTFDLSSPEESTETTENLLAELNSLTGLLSVKNEVNQLVNLLKVQKMREERGMKTTSTNKHVIFSGNPGSGKTTVARLLSKIYASIGVVSKGHLIEVDRSGLVSGYIGQTALKVQDVVESALGGILFIDEAYALTNYKGEGDFGQEAVDTLLKCMEDHRDDLIVICAGYTDLMAEFVESNPGLKSRFSKVIEFEDYTAEEEMEILKSMSKKQDYQLSNEATQKALAFFTERCENKPKNFANARDVRNYLEKAVTNHATRIISQNNEQTDINDITLKTIEACDLEGINLD